MAWLRKGYTLDSTLTNCIKCLDEKCERCLKVEECAKCPSEYFINSVLYCE